MTSLKTTESLATRYRPHNFETFIGQDVVKGVVKGMLIEKTIPNAILITGETGVGKTTLARLINRYVNCKTFSACGECTSCKEKTHPDYHELDMANKRNIDDARALIQSAKLKPRHRMRIMCLDEAHMMNNFAQNTMLKPTEKSTSHTLWIITTTDPDKLISALRGRCLSLRLNPVDSASIAVRLKEIMSEDKGLKVKVPDKIISLIADMSEGHMRDAISLFEQIRYYLISLGEKDTPDKKTTLRLLNSALYGADTTADANTLLRAMYKKEAKEIISTLLDTSNLIPLLHHAISLNKGIIRAKSVGSIPTYLRRIVKDTNPSLSKATRVHTKLLSARTTAESNLGTDYALVALVK